MGMKYSWSALVATLMLLAWIGTGCGEPLSGRQTQPVLSPAPPVATAPQSPAGEPEPVAPGSAASGSAAPEPVAPGSAASGSAASGSAAPATQEPDGLAPGGTAGGAAAGAPVAMVPAQETTTAPAQETATAPAQETAVAAPYQEQPTGEGSGTVQTGPTPAPAAPHATEDQGSSPPPGAEETAAPAERLPMETLERGFYSGLTDPMVRLVTTAEEWERLWQQHTSRAVPPPPPPRVDFSREAMVVAALGERTSGGYSITITGVRYENGRLVVEVQKQAPPPGAMTTMALTQPYHMVRIPWTGGQVEVQVRGS